MFWIRIITLLLCGLALPSVALQLLDGQSFIYDIGKDGVLTQGTLNAYANMYRLRVNQANYVGNVVGLSADGREARTASFTEPNSGLQIERRVYVSKTDNFARYTDILGNPNTVDRSVDIEISGTLGGDTTHVVADQGNLLITQAVVQNGTSNAPVLLHYHSQVGAKVVAKHTLSSGNHLSWTYPKVIVPGKGQIRLIYFVAQARTTEAALNTAQFIFNNPSALYEDIGKTALTYIVNFTPPAPTPSGDLTSAPFLTMGEVRKGILQDSTPLSHVRAGTPADVYALKLTAGQQFTAHLSAGFNAYLYLFVDALGNAVTVSNDDYNINTTNAAITYTAPKDGTYYLEATAHLPNERGSYSLEIIPGITNHAPNAYHFEFPTEKLIAPAMVTFTDFSADPDGTIVERCWQFGDGSPLACTTNTMITHTFTEAGRYSVSLTVRDNNGALAYRTERLSVSAIPQGIVLPLANTVTGELVSSDPRSQTRVNAYTNRYRVSSAPIGQELVIDLRSTNADPYLYLYDQFNQRLRQDHDTGGDHHAQIRYTPVESGDLLIEATTFLDNTAGNYSLSLNPVTTNTAVATTSPELVEGNINVPIDVVPTLSNPLLNLFIARLPDTFNPTLLVWNFGDGSPLVSSSEPVASHVYAKSGNFVVTVTALNVINQQVVGHVNAVIANQVRMPQARFHVTPLFGEKPLRVFFTNESSGIPSTGLGNDTLSYTWQFGDGQVSTSNNPPHTYTQAGTYNVTLQAHSTLMQQSSSFSLPITVIDRSSPNIPLVNISRERPQVLMAGLDPMLIDLLDTDIKLFAIVRPGKTPIQTVNLIQQGGQIVLVLQQVATFANGDQRYETVFPYSRGLLPVATFADLFGNQNGQFKLRAIDQAGQFHDFPDLEIGNNPALAVAPVSLYIEPLRQIEVRRSQPQVLAAGFDPALLDVNETQFTVKAIVREGAYPVQSVTVKQNQGQFNLNMHLLEILPNGDKLYAVTYTYPKGELKVGTLGSLLGSQAGQFTVVVTDQAQQSHRFPEVKIGNFPQQ